MALTLHSLQSLVAKLGYAEHKPVGQKAFDVLVAPTLVGRAALKIFEALAKHRAKLDGSTITAEGFKITVKDRTRFVKFTSQNKGGKAEDRFYHHIKDLLKLMPELDILFTDGKHKFKVKRVTKITKTGDKGTKKDGKGTGKKADFILTTKSGDVPISLKGKMGEQLASADSLWRENARKLIQWAIDEGSVTLTSIGQNLYTMDKPIVVEATDEEVKAAAFGTDILPHGAVVKGEMLPHHFALDAKKGLATVTCMKLFLSADDFVGMDKVSVQLRNDKSRANTKGDFWGGIRITIVVESNIRTERALRIPKSLRRRIGI